tara:strand:- start:46 stop:288 length:243 start_codon:yes stop_codon:yes gene_type:complete
MIMATKRKRKRKITKKQASKRLGISEFEVAISKYDVIQRIKKHKLRFDLDYERGVYDMTPTEADIYDDSIDDILTIIRKM